MKMLTLLLLLSFPALSQINIQVIDPDIDASDFEKDYRVKQEAEEFSSLPEIEKRDHVVKSVKASATWDELKKDIFYMDLKSKSLPDLVKKYPEVSQQQLKKLKGKLE